MNDESSVSNSGNAAFSGVLCHQLYVTVYQNGIDIAEEW